MVWKVKHKKLPNKYVEIEFGKYKIAYQNLNAIKMRKN